MDVLIITTFYFVFEITSVLDLLYFVDLVVVVFAGAPPAGERRPLQPPLLWILLVNCTDFKS